MNNKEYAAIVVQELTHTLTAIDEEQAEKFVELIDEADEVFCAGAGRSGFQVKGFAMRLMHMGVASYVVGETCTPNIKEGGVLVVCSGSGETKSLVNHAAKAKEMGARVALITINPSPVWRMSLSKSAHLHRKVQSRGISNPFSQWDLCLNKARESSWILLL